MESCAGPDCFGGVQVVVEKQVERVIIQTVLAASSVTLKKVIRGQNKHMENIDSKSKL